MVLISNLILSGAFEFFFNLGNSESRYMRKKIFIMLFINEYKINSQFDDLARAFMTYAITSIHKKNGYFIWHFLI